MKRLFLLFALLCAAAQGAWADTYDYPEKTKPQFYASYDGKPNVVVINTAAELAYITEHFDEDSEFPVDDDDWSELNYYLNADINMGNSYSWMPLGRESYWVTSYEGKFWGNGHTITYMIRGLDEENQGLFSTIHEDGKVYDVNVVCDIYTQRDYVGGIAGENNGMIENCTVTANIVSEDHDDVGGIVGWNIGTGIVKNCRVTGLVKGKGSAKYVGGITGGSHRIKNHPGQPQIVNCWVEADVSSEHDNDATSAYVGGIAGYNQGIVSYCCVTGNVTNPADDCVGGIVGMEQIESLYGKRGVIHGGTIDHCTFYGVIDNAHSRKSDFIGDGGQGSNLYREFNQAEYDDAVSNGHDLYAYAIRNVFALSVTTTGTGTVTVSDFNAETIDYDKVPTGHWIYVNITSGVVVGVIAKDADDNDVEVIRYHQYGDNYYMFPMPRSNVSVTVNFTTQQGDGSEENPYVISTAEDWEAFAKNVNDNHKSYAGEYVMLGGDLEVSTYSSLGTNVGFSNAFKGTFDGNGHTLTCAYAPFTRVMDATIKNLHVTGSSYYGSIVDYSKGTLNLINCRSSVNLDCGAGKGYGGLVRTMVTDATYVESPNPNSVTIDGCVFDGSITSTVENENRATDCSGFVGDAGEGGTVVIRNSLLKPASVGTGILSNTFAKMGNNGTLTIENSYFVATDNLPANQGTQARTVSAGADVTLSGLGEAATTYGSNGITAYAHGISYGGTNYAGGGESVSLTLRHGSKTGYTFGGYTASAGTISGTTLTMPDADVTIGAAWTRFLDGTGTDDDPYIIGTTDEWNIFASSVNSGTGFSGKVVMLTASISVSEMAGISYDKAFQGTFDGDGHTLTFTKGTDAEPFAEEYCAPFRHVKNADIANLHVDGTIYTSRKKAAGIVGESLSGLYLYNCRSSVDIHSSVSGDGTHGGLVSTLSGSENDIYIDGCVFDGSFATTAGTNNCGGFVGWPVYNRPVIENSLMIPASVGAGMLANTFTRVYSTNEPTITNCYYVAVDNLPANQGTEAAVLNITPANPDYDYGMVKAYKNGIWFDGNFYGTLATVTLADNADNTTIITGANGSVADVTLSGRTLYKDGAWNTLCLPFDVSTTTGPLSGDGVEVQILNTESSNLSGTVLTLNFDKETTGTIAAGTPFIIKWTKPDGYDAAPDAFDIIEPEFRNVTITSLAPTAQEFEGGKFIGQYSSFKVGDVNNGDDGNLNEIIVLGADNTIGYYDTPRSLRSFRAHFEVPEQSSQKAAKRGIVKFADGTTTDVILIPDTNTKSEWKEGDEWYTTDGIMLPGRPTEKGEYINNGRTIVIF